MKLAKSKSRRFSLALPVSRSTPSLSSPHLVDTASIPASASTTDFGLLVPPPTSASRPRVSLTSLASIPENDQHRPSESPPPGIKPMANGAVSNDDRPPGKDDTSNAKSDTSKATSDTSKAASDTSKAKDSAKAKQAGQGRKERRSLTYATDTLVGALERIKSLRRHSRSRPHGTLTPSTPAASKHFVQGASTETTDEWGVSTKLRLAPSVPSPAQQSPMTPLPPSRSTVPIPTDSVLRLPGSAVHLPSRAPASTPTLPSPPSPPSQSTRSLSPPNADQSEPGKYDQPPFATPLTEAAHSRHAPNPPPPSAPLEDPPQDVAVNSPGHASLTSSPTSYLSPRGARPLSSAPSMTSYGSGESVRPLIAHSVPPRTVGIMPARDPARKLVKKRPSRPSQEIELVGMQSSSGESPPATSTQGYNPQIFTLFTDTTVPSSLTTLPAHQHSSSYLVDQGTTLIENEAHFANSTLCRNVSSSTSSSTLYQRTEESGMVQTPRELDKGPVETDSDTQSRNQKNEPPQLEGTEQHVIIMHEPLNAHGTLESRCHTPSSQAASQVHSVSSGDTARPVFQHDPSIPLGPTPLNSDDRVDAVESLRSTADARRSSGSFEALPSTDIRGSGEHSAFLQLARTRSSSQGTSNTNSICSIGEVKLATEAIVSSARMVHFSLDTPVRGDLAEEASEAIARSSAAIKQALAGLQAPRDVKAGTRRRTTEWSDGIKRSAPARPPLYRGSSSPSSILAEAISLRTSVTRPPLPTFQPSTDGPTSPERSSSFGRLWRRLSSSGRQRTTPHGGDTLNEEPVMVSPVRKRPTPLSHIEYTVPDVPSPALPTHRKEELWRMSNPQARRHKLSHPASLKNKGMGDGASLPSDAISKRVRTSSLPQASLSQNQVIEESIGTAAGSGTVYSSTPYASRSSVDLGAVVASRFGAADLPLAHSPLPQQTSALASRTLDGSALQVAGVHTDSGEELIDGSPATEVHEDLASHEAKRRFRQSLVDIQNDWDFQREAQNLLRLEPTGRADWSGRYSASGASVGAWFVTRELVQGERRHGRLLFRGVEMVRTAVEIQKDDIKSAPPSPRSGALVLKSSHRLRRQKTAPSSSASSEERRAKLASRETSVTPVGPLDLLLVRLPRLLALSLKLSTRFDHDPSPAGVAAAFSEMEARLTSEIGLWASEIGSVITTGLGESVGTSRRRSTADALGGREEDQEDRLGLADIIIAPIQRAARYKLLFQEMIGQLPAYPTVRRPIEDAILAADRLAAECDRCQSTNMELIRRSTTTAMGEQGARSGRGQTGKRVRPKSLGNVGGSRSWFAE